MPEQAAKPHYLRRNHDSWTPAAVAFLDSETHTIEVGRVEVEQLACWTAEFVRRRHRRKAGEVERAEGEDGAAAAAAIDAWATSDKSTWLYAHNVTFDLVTTRLAEHLSRLGWELSRRHALSGSAPWMILHKGKQVTKQRRKVNGRIQTSERIKWQHTLTIADSFSLMPVALAVLAEYSPFTKPPLPADREDLAAMLDRCRADVSILSWAVLTLMDWWDDHDLGKWSYSGAACGWNSYRHQIDGRAVVIDPDPDVVGWEHQAIYGGRRDVFRCGQLPPGAYAEIDFTAAYPTIAATQPLPCKRMGKLTEQISRAILDGRCPYGMIAEVTITTDVPRWPLRTLGRVFYPVGTFTTTLAGPDILTAHKAGALDKIGPGYFYAMSDHMRPWADWILQLQQQADQGAPGPVRIWAKGASRSVCGKWAQRDWRTLAIPGPPDHGWSYEDAWVAGSDARAAVCGLGSNHYLSVADKEGEHEFPAVLAYIEAHCRVRLAAVLDAAPPGAVLQCDTDGLMANLQLLAPAQAELERTAADSVVIGSQVEQLLADWSALTAPLAMRVKNRFARAIVYGPQHVVLDGRPRFSGVPGSAWATGDNRWAARLWPGLSWQIQHGQGEGYARPVQPYLVVGPYAAGWVLDGGAVRPVEASISEDGTCQVRPWPLTRWAAAGDRLAPDQAAWSHGLIDLDRDQEAIAHV